MIPIPQQLDLAPDQEQFIVEVLELYRAQLKHPRHPWDLPTIAAYNQAGTIIAKLEQELK